MQITNLKNGDYWALSWLLATIIVAFLRETLVTTVLVTCRL